MVKTKKVVSKGVWPGVDNTQEQPSLIKKETITEIHDPG
jgi:hypothetical protein